ncbi:transmembrane protein [Citrus sinensis]|uniref:Transmembrane protein n=1 Tax=Citrus sinensis TaxID=2711 RepID=A0ACB8LEG7_CITSI|nr:transmembrane protein [Citrus sinensis]
MITMSVAAATPLPCFKNHSILSTKSFNSKPPRRHFDNATISSQSLPPVQKQRRIHLTRTVVCHAARRKPTVAADASKASAEGNDNVRRVLQIVLWAAEAVYILWLFLLPYAPMSEGLFNFVIGWTFMFAPLLFTDCKRDRYKGSLDVLWGFQMFLTNTFLIPYMAIRLNEAGSEDTPRDCSQLASVMTNGAPIVGLIGGAICLLSTLWALYGRMDGDFGGITERWEFLVSYLGSERLAYAFIWDIFLYIIFQAWLIGDNLQNVQLSKVGTVNYLRFVPVVGLTAYLLFLNLDEEQ